MSKLVYRIDRNSLIGEITNVFSKVQIVLPSVNVNLDIFPDSIGDAVVRSLEESGSLVQEDLIPQDKIDKNMIRELYLHGLDLKEQLEKGEEQANTAVENALDSVEDARSTITSYLDDAESYIYDAKNETDGVRAESVDTLSCEVKLDKFNRELETLREALDAEAEE